MLNLKMLVIGTITGNYVYHNPIFFVRHMQQNPPKVLKIIKNRPVQLEFLEFVPPPQAYHCMILI